MVNMNDSPLVLIISCQLLDAARQDGNHVIRFYGTSVWSRFVLSSVHLLEVNTMQTRCIINGDRDDRNVVRIKMTRYTHHVPSAYRRKVKAICTVG